MANRATRRKDPVTKALNKKQYSLLDIQKALTIAIEMKKITKGHLFSKNMKDQCVFCGATMKTKLECDYHLLTLFDRLQSILINPDFYTEENIQCLWLQHGEEYQNIQLPLVVGAKRVKKA